MFFKRLLPTLAALLLSAVPAAADDAYFHVPIKDLEITEGKLPDNKTDGANIWSSRGWRLSQQIFPYGTLDRPGEIYVQWESQFPTVLQWQNVQVVIRAPQGADVTGRLVLPQHDFHGMTTVKFKLPASAAKDDNPTEFYKGKAAHYRRLWQAQLPGGAWFRHQLSEAQRKLGDKPDEARIAPGVARTDSLGDTYDLFSGGRAIAENLQLDRTMPNSKDEIPTVGIDTLKGITVAEIDWRERLKDKPKPALDRLAAAIPADQHAVFFPSFAKMLEVADHAEEQGTRVLTITDPRSEDAHIKERYERQLCLSTSALSRLLGPRMVRSVAVTGSDPYFATGTDVAILFEAANPDGAAHVAGDADRDGRAGGQASRSGKRLGGRRRLQRLPIARPEHLELSRANRQCRGGDEFARATGAIGGRSSRQAGRDRFAGRV